MSHVSVASSAAGYRAWAQNQRKEQRTQLVASMLQDTEMVFLRETVDGVVWRVYVYGEGCGMSVDVFYNTTAWNWGNGQNKRWYVGTGVVRSFSSMQEAVTVALSRQGVFDC